MSLRGEVRKRIMTDLLEYFHSFRYIPEVQCVVKLPHHIRAHLRDLQHLAELLHVTCDEIEERKTFEVFRLLVGELNDLVIALVQRCDTEFVPSILIIDLLSTTESNFNISAFKRQFEARPFILVAFKKK